MLTWPRSGIDFRYDFRYGLVCKNRCMFTSDASMLPLADAVIVKKNLHTSEVRFPNISELVHYLTLWSNFQVVGFSFNRVPDLRTMSTCRGTILRLGILTPQQYLVAYLKVPVPVILLWKHTQNVIYNTSPGTCPNVQTWSSCSLRCSMNRQLCTRKLFTDCTEYWTTLTHGIISTSRGPTGLWYTHRSSYFNFTHFDDKGISKTVTRT